MKKLKCLHICNDFLGSSVHKNLYSHLIKEDIEQTIFIPLRYGKEKKLTDLKESLKVEYIVSDYLKPSHRVFFRKKIKFLYKPLKFRIIQEKFNIVHATTLFSDGALALKVYKDFNIPYIVTIRSTDIDAFFRFRPDLSPLANEILTKSSKIIFISNALKERFFKLKNIANIKELIKDKSIIINNGIDDYWLKNKNSKQILTTPYKLLYVGSLVGRKNVVQLIKSVIQLNNSGLKYELTIVGEGGEYEKSVKHSAKKFPAFIKYLGAIKNLETLKSIYNQNQVFVLPSTVETFGLVYIEALTQGLPTIHCRNQGIDGTFKKRIATVVEPNSLVSLKNGIEDTIKNYEQFELNKIDFSRFSWKLIANKYKHLYQTIK